jgi:hypothetical protein
LYGSTISPVLVENSLNQLFRSSSSSLADKNVVILQQTFRSSRGDGGEVKAKTA